MKEAQKLRGKLRGKTEKGQMMDWQLQEAPRLLLYYATRCSSSAG